MKKYKINSQENIFEIVMPFGAGGSASELFDDCPLCQELKKKIERGEVEDISLPFEDFNAN